MTHGSGGRTKPKPIRWSILFLEIVLLIGLGFGGSTLLFHMMPISSSAVVIVLILATFLLTRHRIDAQTHIIIVFSLWVALLLLSIAFPQSPVGRAVGWVADIIDQ